VVCFALGGGKWVRITKCTIFFILLSSMVLMLSGTVACAQEPNITGTYSGLAVVNDFNCGTGAPGNPPLFPDETDNDAQFDLTITTQSGTSFSGSGTVFSSDILTDVTFSGTVDASGNISGSFSSVDSFGTASGSISGTISGGTWNLFASGQDDSTVDNVFCQFTVVGTLTLISGGTTATITPDVTPSSTITEAVLFNTQIQTQVSDISKHITGALGGRRFFGGPRVSDNQFKMEGATGLSAGDGTTIPYGVWGSYSYTDFDNDLSSTAFDGNSHSFLGGLDFAFWENTVLGVAFGYDNGDIDTTFNLGHQDTDSYTIAPYFGALLSDTLSLDFNVGYSRVDYDQFRTLPGTTTRVSSSPNADRWFGALNLNGVTYYDNWILGARVGALWAKSVIDSYTESNGTVVAESRARVGEGIIAGDVAYTYKNFEPFMNVSYQYDFELTKVSVTTGPQPSNDRDDILMTAGVRYYDNNGISGNLEYTKRFDRDDFDEDRISITVRVDF